MQRSCAGRPAMRHTNPGNRTVPSKAMPARLSASSPELGRPGAQRVWTPPPSSWKSTTTVTPEPPLHGPDAVARTAADVVVEPVAVRLDGAAPATAVGSASVAPRAMNTTRRAGRLIVALPDAAER